MLFPPLLVGNHPGASIYFLVGVCHPRENKFGSLLPSPPTTPNTLFRPPSTSQSPSLLPEPSVRYSFIQLTASASECNMSQPTQKRSKVDQRHGDKVNAHNPSFAYVASGAQAASRIGAHTSPVPNPTPIAPRPLVAPDVDPLLARQVCNTPSPSVPPSPSHSVGSMPGSPWNGSQPGSTTYYPLLYNVMSQYSPAANIGQAGYIYAPTCTPAYPSMQQIQPTALQGDVNVRTPQQLPQQPGHNGQRGSEEAQTVPANLVPPTAAGSATAKVKGTSSAGVVQPNSVVNPRKTTQKKVIAVDAASAAPSKKRTQPVQGNTTEAKEKPPQRKGQQTLAAVTSTQGSSSVPPVSTDSEDEDEDVDEITPVLSAKTTSKGANGASGVSSKQNQPGRKDSVAAGSQNVPTQSPSSKHKSATKHAQNNS